MVRPFVLAAALAFASTTAAANQLYWGSSGAGGGLFRMDLDDLDRIGVEAANGFFYGGVAVDSVNGFVYWSVTGTAGGTPPVGIFRTDLFGGGDGLVVPGVSSDYITVDPIHDRLCWTENTAVRCATLLGADITDVDVLTGNEDAGQLALDLDTGDLYWSILNGTTFQVFAEGNASPVRSRSCSAFLGLVAVDHVARRLYTGCQRSFDVSDLDGQNLVALPNPGVGDRGLSIDPFGGKLYLDSGFGSLHRMNLDGTGLEQIANIGSDRGTALFLEELVQPVSCTVADNGTTVTITCPDGTTATVEDGVDGANGSNGAKGSNGSDGVDGANGADGADGATGPAGPEGPAGPAGPAGPEGPAGGCASTAPGAGPLALLALLGLTGRRRRRD